MIDLNLVATVNGTEYRVTPTAAALIVLERKFGQPAATLFAAPSIEHLAFLAWEQARRDAQKGGPVVVPWDQWVNELENVETVTGDDADGPKG